MRHHGGINKLGRTGQHRRATLRNLATALFTHEQIETTAAKAKVLRPFAEHLITLGKRGDLHARRQVVSKINDAAAVRKLFDDIAKRVATRPGGYTRILKLGLRRGDRAERALVELVDRTAPVVATPAATATP